MWQKLDKFNSGSIQVKDIVANANFVKQECPELLEEHGRIARGGVVKYQDFRRLLLGLLDGPQRSGSGQGARGNVAPKMTEEEAWRLFEQLKDLDGVITTKALVERKAVVMEKMPQLIQDFEKIDLDGDSKITWAELKVYVGGTAEWLEHQLSSVVGLVELKDQVRAFYRSVMLDQTRRNQGHDVRGMAKAPHMIFQGNPGTGKTSLGRIMAKLLHRIGVTSSPDLREVQRPDLVGEHVGHTGPKTQAVIDSSKAGVLFIDEAYRLTGVESKNDFGREAVETLMAAMNEPPGKSPVMIFAGYNKDMANFMRANEGLYRRITYTFDFSDYSCQDLALILELIVNGNGFRLDDALLAEDRMALARLLEETTQPRSRSLMNGGICERIFDAAKQNLDARDDPENPSVLLLHDDIHSACVALPPPPEPEPPQIQSAVEEEPKAVAPSVVPEAIKAPPSNGPAALAPAQQEMGGKNERNVWFHLEAGKGLRKASSCCSFGAPLWVSARLDGREVHRSQRLPADAGRSAAWRETRIIPYNDESLIEFVVYEGANFVGSATYSLKGMDVFDGELELRANDRSAGRLRLRAGWQVLLSETGGDLLREVARSTN